MLDVFKECSLQRILVGKVAGPPHWDHVVDVHHHPQNVRLRHINDIKPRLSWQKSLQLKQFPLIIIIIFIMMIIYLSTATCGR